jgi:lipoprotein-anchoring transpeptidase ErfK/SrfK
MPSSTNSRTAWPVVLVIAAAVLALAACGTGSPSAGTTRTVTAAPVSDVASSSPSPSPSVPTSPVHVSSLQSDGQTYGVGMPVILRFTPAPTDSTEFTKAATVTVNGQPAGGAWFWEQPYADGPMEAHYRAQAYWPSNATIRVNLPIAGLSAGTGLAYDGKLTSLTFQTGDAHVSTVDASGLKMTVTSNGATVKTIPVSLGAAKTPTYNGVKVVMQKGEATPGVDTLRPNGAVRMTGPGYDEIVNWSVRVTASGEYVHAAPWNSRIGQASTSNGCTNLDVADAQWFYNFSLVGDVVNYVGTDGTKMPPLDGYGDWNVPWGQWQQGGELLNH